MSDVQTKSHNDSRHHPFLRVVLSSGIENVSISDATPAAGTFAAGLARTGIPIGADLLTIPGTALDDNDALHRAFARAVQVDHVRFRLAADVGIVEIRRRGEDPTFFNIDITKLQAGAWEREAVIEYLKRSLVSPIGTLANQLPRGAISKEPRPLSLAPRLRPAVAQAAHVLGFQSGASVELVAKGIPGGVELVLRSGGTTVHLAWNIPHKLLLDVRFV